MENLLLPHFVLSPLSRLFRLRNTVTHQKTSANMVISCPYCRKIHQNVDLSSGLITHECGICWEDRQCKRFNCSTSESPHAFCLPCLQQIDQSEVDILELVTGTLVPTTVYRNSIKYFTSGGRPRSPNFTIYSDDNYIWLFDYPKRKRSKEGVMGLPHFYRFDLRNEQHIILLTKRLKSLKRRSRFFSTDQNIIPSPVIPRELNKYIINLFTERLVRSGYTGRRLGEHLIRLNRLYLIRSTELEQYRTRMMGEPRNRHNPLLSWEEGAVPVPRSQRDSFPQPREEGAMGEPRNRYVPQVDRRPNTYGGYISHPVPIEGDFNYSFGSAPPGFSSGFSSGSALPGNGSFGQSSLTSSPAVPPPPVAPPVAPPPPPSFLDSPHHSTMQSETQPLRGSSRHCLAVP